MKDKSDLTAAASLEESVEDALEASPEIARYPIGVAVQGTSVSLTGEVGSQAAKEAAERIARGVRGVIDVTNELVVVDRDDAGWNLFGGRRRRRDTADTTGADGDVDETLGVAALGAANRGPGTGSTGGVGGIGAGGIGLGAGAALATEGAAGDLADDEGYHRGEDTEDVRG